MEIISVEQRIYVGSIGITIDLSVKNYSYEVVDLSALMGIGGVAYIIIEKPDGTLITRNALITGTGNSILRYISVAGDFDEPGIYSFHGKLTNTNILFYTEPVEIQVRNLFDEAEIPEEI